MRRQILVRLLLSVLTWQIVAQGLLQLGESPGGGDSAAAAGLAVLGLLATLAMADVVVNDMLPARYSLHCAFRWRHLVWGCMSAAYCGSAFVLARSFGELGLAGICLTLASGCMGVGFMDLRYRAQHNGEGA